MSEDQSNNDGRMLKRRDLLAGALSTTALAAVPRWSHGASLEAGKTKSIAAVVTIYQPGSHADVRIGKILEGWKQDEGVGPALTLASLYVDQYPSADLARRMAKKHSVPIFDSIEKAVTVGTNAIPVDGVISIGEHGSYPSNRKGQHLYPRRRFFTEITDTFRKYERVTPVFSDKHLGPVWSDAKWMYDRAKQIGAPFMAGSSLPVSFRKPAIDVPMNCEIEAAVGVGYSGLDIYGSHSLDCYQCLVERRRGGERGVVNVQCLEGEAVWDAVKSGEVPRNVFDSVLALAPRTEAAKIRADRDAVLFRFDYADGFRGFQFMIPTFGRIAVGLRLKGQSKPIATQFEERIEPRHPHFAYLLKAIEQMMHSGRPTYPVERTLLTSGVLDRALTSRSQGGKKLLTPELAISYRPVDYPHAPFPDLASDPMASDPMASDPMASDPMASDPMKKPG